MNQKRLSTIFAVLTIVVMILSACAPAPAEPVVEVQTQIVKQTEVVVQTQVVETVKEVLVTPTPGPNPEAVIADVEPGAEITFWTFFLSPTFDQYIADTIARFNQAYPGVTVKWEDRQGTLQEEYRNSLAAGNAPDVVNIPTSWVREFAQKDQLINMTEFLPQAVKDQYYPGLFDQALVGGNSYQLPWYQALDIFLANTQLLTQAGLTIESLPSDVYALKDVCKTIKETTGTPCGLRLHATDGNLMRDMVYEGGVTLMDADGKFVFNSPEAVTWLKFYQEMIANDWTARDILLADDRTGLERFTAGQMPFYVTGPQLIRVVRENNPGLYGYLAVAPQATGVSGKLPPVSMSIVVSKQTKFPKASAALANFFTNPQSMLEFSKIVSIFPSTPASYDDPFFTQKPIAIEESGRPLAKEIISKQSDIMPEIPSQKEVEEIVKNMFEQVVFGNADPQQALDEAVAAANALIGK
jgi:putative chitobiose transport system substrate-binding protein